MNGRTPEQEDEDDRNQPSPYYYPRLPAHRYTELPEKTRKWLENLRDDDIDTINDAIKFQEQAKTVGKFGKYLILSFAGIVILMAQFGEGAANLLKLIGLKGGIH